MPSFDQTPDEPEPFGYKISWFALKTSDPAAVLEAIEAEEVTTANWESGLAAAHFHGDSQKGDPWLFISPPVSGWIFAVSFSLPYPVTIEGQDDSGAKFDALFSRLMERFDEVQFFGSYRVIDFTAWGRALKGKMTRLFAFVGSEGQVFANFGAQTEEEAKLRLPDLTGLSPLDATERMFAIAEEEDDEKSRLIASGLSADEARARVAENGIKAFPNETDVTDLAGLWSLDPTELSGLGEPPGLGWAARLPKHLAE